jgi:hypothetical protein
MALATAVLMGGWVDDRWLPEGGGGEGGLGVGEVVRRAPVWPPALAWVRCGPELYLLAVTAVCTSTVPGPFSSQSSFSFRFLELCLQARYSVSVYIRPICINALFVPEPFLPTLV